MDTKLEKAEDLFNNHLDLETINYTKAKLKQDILTLIINTQKDAIAKTLQFASERADADYNITGIDDDGYPSVEVYVINSSILGLKDEIFTLNNL
jgi:hypothetical protein